ncbi:hypothetical protein M422DRAFT_40347 [Sphaerobolus stellatus SS14]|nr:hypothetical protein M422DRAFT_40347 [Sphaerobolus stellatus SS14]
MARLEYSQLYVSTIDAIVIDPRANRGYVTKGRERSTQSKDDNLSNNSLSSAAEIAAIRTKAPDYKESMEIGRDWDPLYKNFWPEESEPPGFKQSMKEFFQVFYLKYSLLSHPPVKASVLQQEGQARLGAHSDYGSLTFVSKILYVGWGLEVQNLHTKQLYPVTPIEGTIVVNVGDLLARWSNDILRSTLHRVVALRRQFENEEFTPARQSIAFFCNPNGGATISCLLH